MKGTVPSSGSQANPASAREKLLQAAATVFARDGLQGATTRAIAREAGVNEVTLFRIFETKERLLAEVLTQERQAVSEAIAQTAWSEDLATTLRAYAASYNDMLEKNEAIIRTLIGEARRQPEYAKQVIQDAVRPVREGLIHYLEKAQQEGKVKPDLKLPAAVDLFTGMLLAGMLRRTAHGIADYAIPDYIDTCLEIFVSGIAKPKRKRK